MLGAAPERLRRVFPGTSGPTGRDPLAGMTTLEAVLGRRPRFDETMTALAEGFREVHALELSPGGLAVPEMERAETLVREKYGTERWTRAGRSISARTISSPGAARGSVR
jgi:lipoate-protein ligase A